MNKRANSTIAQEITDKNFFLRDARKNEIAMKIRMHMKKCGLQAKDLAERLNISEADISKSLSGKQNLTIEKIYSLSDAMESFISFSIDKLDTYQDIIGEDFSEIQTVTIGSSGEIPCISSLIKRAPKTVDWDYQSANEEIVEMVVTA